MAAMMQSYVKYGCSDVTFTVVVDENSEKDLPVSTSVMLTAYCVMIPFCMSAGGGLQNSVITVELIAFPCGVWGGLDGTGKSLILYQWKIYAKKKKNIASYHLEKSATPEQE